MEALKTLKVTPEAHKRAKAQAVEVGRSLSAVASKLILDALKTDRKKLTNASVEAAPKTRQP